MKKPILLALALAFSGSAFADDIDRTVKAIGAKYVVDDTSGLCKSLKNFLPSHKIGCFRMDYPLFLIKKNYEMTFLRGGAFNPSETNFLAPYIEGQTEFKQEFNDIFSYTVNITYPTKTLIAIYLDPVNKYSTYVILDALF